MLRHKVMERTLRTMGLHPKYLEVFTETHERLISGDGPISVTDRHFIALMAVARHSCTELMNVHEAELKSAMVNNQVITMKGKIKRLDSINKLLAHRPWEIKKHHIKELLKGENAEDKWSLNELVIAMIFLCHFHALSSFVLGCGLINEPTAESPPPSASVILTGNHETDEKVTNILRKMEHLMSINEELELSEVVKHFENAVKGQEEAVHQHLKSRSRSSTPASEKDEEIKYVDPTKYTSDLDFQYEDFVKRSNPEDSPTFREAEFGWIDYAYNVVNNFGGEDISDLLDSKFQLITDLTYRNIGKFEAVDTKLFRMAVQRYAQCLFGIRHDDYNYSQINILLPRRLKTYIKTLCCFPERCTVEEYEAIMADFRNSEKVHVCLLVCEARLQAELLYGLKAISEYYA